MAGYYRPWPAGRAASQSSLQDLGLALMLSGIAGSPVLSSLMLAGAGLNRPQPQPDDGLAHAMPVPVDRGTGPAIPPVLPGVTPPPAGRTPGDALFRIQPYMPVIIPHPLPQPQPPLSQPQPLPQPRPLPKPQPAPAPQPQPQPQQPEFQGWRRDPADVEVGPRW